MLAPPQSINDVVADEKTERKAFKIELNESKRQANKKAKMETQNNVEEAISFKDESPAAGDLEGHPVTGEKEGHPDDYNNGEYGV